MIENIIENYPEETFLKADGFDEAILGVEENEMRLIYSVSKCIHILQTHMSYEEALEYFNYNIGGAYVGDRTPIWCYDF